MRYITYHDWKEVANDFQHVERNSVAPHKSTCVSYNRVLFTVSSAIFLWIYSLSFMFIFIHFKLFLFLLVGVKCVVDLPFPWTDFWLAVIVWQSCLHFILPVFISKNKKKNNYFQNVMLRPVDLHFMKVIPVFLESRKLNDIFNFTILYIALKMNNWQLCHK